MRVQRGRARGRCGHAGLGGRRPRRTAVARPVRRCMAAGGCAGGVPWPTIRTRRRRRPRSPRRGAGSPPTIRPTVPALEAMLFQAVPGARPRLRPGHRLHGRRRGDRAGGPGLLRPRHQAGAGGCRADPLPDAPPAHHAVRDVRDQVPRQTADLRRPPVDPAPHRQRERVFRALLDPGQGVLHPVAGTPRGAVGDQPPGPRRRAGRRGGGRGAGPAALRCRTLLRPLRADAERGRRRRSRTAAAWRANWRG